MKSLCFHFPYPAIAAVLAAVWWPPPIPGQGAQGAPGAHLPDIQALEEEGDGFQKKAEPFYRRSAEALEMALRFLERLDDPRGTARILRLRGALLVNLLDSRSFEALREKAGGAEVQPDPLLLSVPPDSAAGDPEPAEEILRTLTAFLGEAGRAYFGSPEKEVRDFPLLFESLGFCERLLGDLYQARADGAYRRALLALEGSGGAGARPDHLARLKYKLRDFEGARLALRREPVDESLLAAADKVYLLRMQRDLARFGGARAEALALNERLLRLGDKAEEIPLPTPALRSFLAGPAHDLLRFAEGLLKVSGSRILSGRESILSEFLAGQAILESGEPARAAEVLEKALGRKASALPPGPEEDPWLAAGIAARLGEARDRSGDFEGAVSGFRKALEDLAGLKAAERFRGKVAIAAASSLFSLGQLEEARGAALAILGEKEIPPDLRVRARILLCGILYSAAGSSKTALDDTLTTLLTAERDRREAKLPEALSEELRALILVHMGNVHRKLGLAAPAEGAGSRASRGLADGERKEAILCMERALEIAAKAPGSERLAASCEANLAELALEAGDLPGARRRVSSALARAEAARSFETQWRARWCLSRILEAEGSGEAAEKELEEAARIVEAHRGRIIGADRKAGFMASKVKLYEAMVSRALARGDGRRAFEAAERSRARSFVESLGLRFLLLGADRDRTIYREYIDLLSKAEEGARGSGELFGIRSTGSYEEFRDKLEALRRKVRESPMISGLVRALIEGEPASAEAVQKDLEPGEWLVEYFGAGESVAAFVAGRSAFNALTLPGSRSEIEAKAVKFADGAAGDPALASELGEKLLAPVLGAMEEAAGGDAGGGPRTIIFVPWGALHRVPFETLLVRGRYLIEESAVSYLPSGSVLKYIEKGEGKRGRPRRLAAFVDPSTDYKGDGKPQMPPLKGARAEVEGIAPFFSEAKVLLGADATESVCSALAPGQEVVHFACHGEFYPARPLDSRLYLSRSEGSDGLLHVAEIYGIDLRGSRLVALSGCETGRSEQGAGEDPVGIGTAFLQAGAGALLVSLWKVEDQATAELMKTFYRRWLEGGDPNRARALREAKIAFLREKARAAPRQWGAFILIGPR